MKTILKQIWRYWNFADRYITVSFIFFLLSFTYQSSFFHVLSFDAEKIVVVVYGQVGITLLPGLKQVKCLLCPEVDCSHCTYVPSFDLKDASTPLCVLEFFEMSTQNKNRECFHHVFQTKNCHILLMMGSTSQSHKVNQWNTSIVVMMVDLY